MMSKKRNVEDSLYYRIKFSGISENQGQYFQHWSLLKKDHKYYAKEIISPKYTRYFYTKAEYDAWKQSKTSPNLLQKAKAKLTNLFSKKRGFPTATSDKSLKSFSQKFKYFAKVTLKDLKVRYFYSKEEYNAFINRAMDYVDDYLDKPINSREFYINGQKFVQSSGPSLRDILHIPKIESRLPSVYYNRKEYEKPNENLYEPAPKNLSDVEKYNHIIRYGPKSYYQEEVQRVKDSLGENYLPLPLKTEQRTFLQDLEDANPNRTKGIEYQENCGYTTLAFELRRRGYNVTAIPDTNGSNTLDQLKWYDVPITDPDIIKDAKEYVDYKNYNTSSVGSFTGRDVAQLYKISQLKKNKSYLDQDDLLSETEKKMSTVPSTVSRVSAIETYAKKNFKDGDRGMFTVSWTAGSGHAMVWEMKDGELHIYDSQWGKEHDLTKIISSSSNFKLFKTNNLKLSNDVLKAVSYK